MAWEHPTGKIPETVTLVAMGPSKNSWVQDQIMMNPIVESEETWTLNAGGGWVGGMDLLFYMDDMLDQYTMYPGRRKALDSCRVPIITTQVYPQLELQAPVYDYPLGDVLNYVGPSNAYFVNSVPYIIAYAMMLHPLGLKRLTMFGVDYHYPGVHAHETGRPCCEFWVGMARWSGLVVQVPDSSTLLDANKSREFYGYLRQPVIKSAPPPGEEIPEIPGAVVMNAQPQQGVRPNGG